MVPLADLSWWPFWHFQPHHNVLWVWLKVGAPGFTIFCMLMFGSLALASSRALTLKDPTLITFAYVAMASVVTSLVFCYVDLGLTNGRITVFLGRCSACWRSCGRSTSRHRSSERPGQPSGPADRHPSLGLDRPVAGRGPPGLRARARPDVPPRSPVSDPPSGQPRPRPGQRRRRPGPDGRDRRSERAVSV